MSEAGTATEGTSAGSLLREAREAAGMHVASLAALLKVPVPKLEALEQDRYDLLPDAVFVRALASSVCRTLKIDPQPVLQRLPQTGQPRLVQDTEHINAPFRSPNDGPAPGVFHQLSRPVVFTVVLLLLGALVLVFLPYAQRGLEAVTQANRPDPVMPPPGAAATVPGAPAPSEAASGPESVAQPAQMPVSASGATPTAAAVTVAPAPAALPAPAATPAPAPAAAASQAAAAAPQAGASGPIGADGVVSFRARGESWVQVTDAKGATVLRKLMRAGETATANGTLPLSVTVGSVQSTDVEVRGAPYNLAPFVRDNVARFQVK